MLKKLSSLILITLLYACGAESNDSTVVIPTDTISSTAVVRFNSNSTLQVLDKGADPESTMFDVCSFSMDPVSGTLAYNLVDQDNLQLGTGTYTYKRALKSPKTKSGVADRVFSVWGVPDVTKEGVTISFEMEVEPELLTFRMTCTG